MLTHTHSPNIGELSSSCWDSNKQYRYPTPLLAKTVLPPDDGVLEHCTKDSVPDSYGIPFRRLFGSVLGILIWIQVLKKMGFF